MLLDDFSDVAVFRNEDEYWTVGFERVVVRMKDAQGIWLSAEVARRARPRVSVLDLVAGTTTSSGQGIADRVSGGSSLLGMQAKRGSSYRCKEENLS